jgi:NADPH:quinone reductase-like Zn-dependent oxidoreductase
MRAAILREYGGVPELGDFPEPEAGEGQAVVEVLAAGLNPVDRSIATGHFYSGSPELPYVVGSEGVGQMPDGSHVYFGKTVAPHGSFAERALIRPEEAFSVPRDLDPALATAFGIAGLAAWLGLKWRGELKAGETVLILGASGPVGQIAVQAARLLGAGHVVAAARSEEGLRRASEYGADATVAISGGDAGRLADAFREAAGGDVDLVFDPLWGTPAIAALAALKPYGRLVQLGQSAAPEATLTSAAIRGTPLTIIGHTNFAVPLGVQRAAYERMARLASAGELTAEVERVPLEDVPEAWERQASAPGRKLAIMP